jgi:hypothetical protein
MALGILLLLRIHGRLAPHLELEGGICKIIRLAATPEAP